MDKAISCPIEAFDAIVSITMQHSHVLPMFQVPDLVVEAMSMFSILDSRQDFIRHYMLAVLPLICHELSGRNLLSVVH